MTDTHLTVPTRLVELNGDQFAYERQLKRIARGQSPRPHESGLSAFLKPAVTGGWGTFRTRRLRART